MSSTSSLNGTENRSAPLSGGFLDRNPELADFVSTESQDSSPHEDESQIHNAAHPPISLLGTLYSCFFRMDFDNRRNFLCTNPLSPLWRLSNLKQKPYCLPVYYALGALGYTLCLPIRTFVFAYALFKSLASLPEAIAKCCWSSRQKESCWAFLGATGELVSGLIGIICPPLAYKIDEWIQNNRPIHLWYRDSLLSLWSFELEHREVSEGDIGMGVVAGEVDLGLALKKERIREELKFYQGAHENLGKYMSELELDSQSPEVMTKIATLGFLVSMQNGHSLSTFKQEALDEAPSEVNKETKKAQLDEHEALFLKYWDTLSSESTSRARGLLSWLPFVGNAVEKTQFEYTGPRLANATLHKLLLFEMVMDRDLVTGNDETYFAGGAKQRDQIHSVLIQVYFKEGTLERYKEDSEVAKHIDAFFGLTEESKEVNELRTKLQGRQPRNHEEFAARQAVVKELNAKTEALRGSLSKLRQEADQYLKQNGLLEMVELDGKEMSLREAILLMLGEVSAFTNDIIATDRRIFKVIMREVYSQTEDDQPTPTDNL